MKKYWDGFVRGGFVGVLVLACAEIELFFLKKTNKEVARLYEE